VTYFTFLPLNGNTGSIQLSIAAAAYPGYWHSAVVCFKWILGGNNIYQFYF